MIPVNMILSLDQGPKWQARWDEGKVRGDDASVEAAPGRLAALASVLARLGRLVRARQAA